MTRPGSLNSSCNGAGSCLTRKAKAHVRNVFPRSATSACIVFGPASWRLTNRQEHNMPLSKTLEKILDRVGTSLLSDVAGVASVAESGSHASSMTSPATPGAERWHGNGVASVSPVRLSHLPPTRRENCVAEQ